MSSKTKTYAIFRKHVLPYRQGCSHEQLKGTYTLDEKNLAESICALLNAQSEFEDKDILDRIIYFVCEDQVLIQNMNHFLRNNPDFQEKIKRGKKMLKTK